MLFLFGSPSAFVSGRSTVERARWARWWGAPSSPGVQSSREEQSSRGRWWARWSRRSCRRRRTEACSAPGSARKIVSWFPFLSQCRFRHLFQVIIAQFADRWKWQFCPSIPSFRKSAFFNVFIHRKSRLNSVFLNKIPDGRIFLLHMELKWTIMYLSKDKLYHCLFLNGGKLSCLIFP